LLDGGGHGLALLEGEGPADVLQAAGDATDGDLGLLHVLPRGFGGLRCLHSVLQYVMESGFRALGVTFLVSLGKLVQLPLGDLTEELDLLTALRLRRPRLQRLQGLVVGQGTRAQRQQA
jgi:hypothetical protein